MNAEMEYVQVLSILNRVSYKPNFEISCRPSDDEWMGPAVLHIIMYVPDSTLDYPKVTVERDVRYQRVADRALMTGLHYRLQPTGVIPVSGSRYVPAHLPEEHFLGWLRHVLVEMEHHELDEWFKLDGVVLNNPHKVSDSGRVT